MRNPTTVGSHNDGEVVGEFSPGFLGFAFAAPGSRVVNPLVRKAMFIIFTHVVL